MMNLLIDWFSSKALYKFVVEFFRKYDDWFYDGLFHLFDLLLRIILKAEVEFFVLGRNWTNTVVKEKYFEQVEVQFCDCIFA